MRRWIPLLVLPACGPEPLTGEDVCDDVVRAVAARVATCADDPSVAEDTDDLFDDFDCLPESLDDEDVQVAARYYYECTGAIAEVPCAAALENRDRPLYWIGQDFHCTSIWGDESDTGRGR